VDAFITVPDRGILSSGSALPDVDSLDLLLDPTFQSDALIRVLIVDDHTTFADLLKGALDRERDLSCVGSARTVEAAVEQFSSLRPDVVVMDYHLLNGDGLEASTRIMSVDRAARIVMLTGDPSPESLERAARIGICAYLPKDGSLTTLLDAVRHARPGGMVVDPLLLSRLAPQTTQASLLTARELGVLRLMATGSDVRTNARALGISESTCRGHVKAILSKLNAHSQLEAVAIATRRGLLRGS
jgi:DNA-binding NarL/FixJ family response regulator